MTKPDGGPAFPCEQHSDYEVLCKCGETVYFNDVQNPGMTLRDYACIKRKVPETDKDWLNELIVKSLRDQFAGKAMSAFIGRPFSSNDIGAYVRDSYKMADAMLEERKK